MAEMLRRRFLQTTVGLGLAIPRPLSLARGQGISNRYVGLQSDEYIGGVEVETRIRDERIFTETGPDVSAGDYQ